MVFGFACVVGVAGTGKLGVIEGSVVIGVAFVVGGGNDFGFGGLSGNVGSGCRRPSGHALGFDGNNPFKKLCKLFSSCFSNLR